MREQSTVSIIIQPTSYPSLFLFLSFTLRRIGEARDVFGHFSNCMRESVFDEKKKTAENQTFSSNNLVRRQNKLTLDYTVFDSIYFDAHVNMFCFLSNAGGSRGISNRNVGKSMYLASSSASCD